MQLARMLRPASRRFDGKIEQALFALRLEAHLTKREILEQYLNRVELGQGTAGVAAAAALYFDTSPGEMSIGQAAMLAGLAHAPSRDNPQVSLRRARSRRNVALARMHRMGVRHARRCRALEGKSRSVSGPRSAPFLAPHFTTRVLGWTPTPATRRARRESARRSTPSCRPSSKARSHIPSARSVIAVSVKRPPSS